MTSTTYHQRTPSKTLWEFGVLYFDWRIRTPELGRLPLRIKVIRYNLSQENCHFEISELRLLCQWNRVPDNLPLTIVPVMHSSLMNSCCRVKDKEFSGSNLRSLAKFYIELEQFLCLNSAPKACIWKLRPDNRLRVTAKFVLPHRECNGPKNAYRLEKLMGLLSIVVNTNPRSLGFGPEPMQLFTNSRTWFLPKTGFAS